MRTPFLVEIELEEKEIIGEELKDIINHLRACLGIDGFFVRRVEKLQIIGENLQDAKTYTIKHD